MPARKNSGTLCEEPLAHLLERRDRPRLREEPLAIPERVRVLGAERSDRRLTHVTDDDVRAHVRADLRDVDLFALVDRSAPNEHLAALVEAKAPPDGPSSAHAKSVPFVREHATRQVRAISEKTEQPRHDSYLTTYAPTRRSHHFADEKGASV